MAKPLTLYDHLDDILEDIANKTSIVKACKDRGIATQTFYSHLDIDDSLRERYTRAKQDRGDACLDTIESYQLMLLRGEIDAPTCRVLVDTEKWKAGKFNQGMYGDKVEQQVTVSYNLFEEKLKEKAAKLDDKLNKLPNKTGNKK